MTARREMGTAINRYVGAIYVDLAPFEIERALAAWDAGYGRGLFFVPDWTAARRAARQMRRAAGRVAAKGWLWLEIGAPLDVLPDLAPDLPPGAVFALRAGGEVSESGYDLALIDAIGAMPGGRGAVVLENAGALAAGTLSGASLDRLIAVGRQLGPSVAARFGGDELQVDDLTLSVGYGEQDDVEALSALLSSSKAARTAARAALAQRGLPASALDRHLPHHHARMGSLAMAEGRPAEALAHFAKAAAIVPDAPGLRVAAIEAAVMAERWDAMAAHSLRLGEATPSHPDAPRWLCLAQRLASGDEPLDQRAAPGFAGCFSRELRLAGPWRFADVAARDGYYGQLLDGRALLQGVRWMLESLFWPRRAPAAPQAPSPTELYAEMRAGEQARPAPLKAPPPPPSAPMQRLEAPVERMLAAAARLEMLSARRREAEL
ncbi:MAG: hypothetical protein KTR21_09370 [Rhodobacteraceae bacterium]|nr:hypothetical protein [Paracoccaceae bacterium]